MNARLAPHFDENGLGTLIQDSTACPRDCYVLVPPLKESSKIFQDEFDLVMGPDHPFFGKLGWAICSVTYHRAHDDYLNQTIIVVKATELGILERSAADRKRAKITPNNLNTIQFILDVKTNQVKLGPRGWIMIDVPLRGRGLGSFLFSELITWAKAIGWSSAEIVYGSLSSKDGEDADNFNRRDHFYRGPGFDIKYYEDGQSGRFSKNSIGELRPLRDRSKTSILPDVVKLTALEAGIALARFSINVTQTNRVHKRAQESLDQQTSMRIRIFGRHTVSAFLAGIILALAGVLTYYRLR